MILANSYIQAYLDTLDLQQELYSRRRAIYEKGVGRSTVDSANDKTLIILVKTVDKRLEGFRRVISKADKGS